MLCLHYAGHPSALLSPNYFPVVSKNRMLVPVVGPVPARYVWHSQMCPQLDVSDKNEKKLKICPTKLDLSDTNYKQPQDMSDNK